MTKQQLHRAAQMLINTKQLTGGDDPKFLPKIYVVNGECCLFLNAARRIAYGTNHPIEVMTIEQAWEIIKGKPAETLDRNEVEWEFNQTGSTYSGSLYCDNYAVQAGMVLNPVVNFLTGQEDPTSHMDEHIEMTFIGVRAQNVLTRIGCKTYGELLKFGRDKLIRTRNVGKTTILEFDTEMDRVGLWNQWKYNKPINA